MDHKHNAVVWLGAVPHADAFFQFYNGIERVHWIAHLQYAWPIALGIRYWVATLTVRNLIITFC